MRFDVNPVRRYELFCFRLFCHFPLSDDVLSQIYHAVASLGQFLEDHSIDGDLGVAAPATVNETGMKDFVVRASAVLRERLLNKTDPTDQSLKAAFTFALGTG